MITETLHRSSHTETPPFLEVPTARFELQIIDPTHQRKMGEPLRVGIRYIFRYWLHLPQETPSVGSKTSYAERTLQAVLYTQGFSPQTATKEMAKLSAADPSGLFVDFEVQANATGPVFVSCDLFDRHRLIANIITQKDAV